ncbi:hypothetical protein BSKO_07455 [Bryopsis sp. KO-2023]|nr:hypothetical protein BSKO_07455 [Bryopsis sp. KO-2023]
MNQPNRFEKFVVPDGVKKVEYEQDTKVPNAGTFIIQREDHTVGNLSRMQLHRDDRIVFSGYRIPHPLQHVVWVKVQTNGSITPLTAYKDAVDDIIGELTEIQNGFMHAFNEYIDRKQQEPALEGQPPPQQPPAQSSGAGSYSVPTEQEPVDNAWVD